MTKNTKIAIAVGSAILVGLTVFMLVRRRRDEDIEDAEVIQEDEQTPVKSQTTTTSTLGIGAFPLKLGSKGEKVKELQRAILNYNSKLLPKYGADGQFNTETENAVLVILVKKTIDSQKDIDEIKNKKSDIVDRKREVATMNRIVLAQRLIDKYNADKRLWFVANKTTLVNFYNIVDNHLEEDSHLEFKKGQMIPTTNAIKVAMTNFGWMRITRPNNKLVNFSPYDFDTILYKS